MKTPQTLKRIMPEITVAAVFSFMLFLYEPIAMYSTNVDDFWFDLKILLIPSLVLFFLFFIAQIALLLFLKHIFKSKKSCYHLFFLLFFAFFLCSYIHSNFLAGFLPPLDGTTISWSDTWANISSFLIVALCIISSIVIFKKLTEQKSRSIAKALSLAIFAMLSVSLLSSAFTKPLFLDKSKDVYATTIGINDYSNNANVIVFVVDAIDSRVFNEALVENPDLASALKDFSYYPDTSSAYPFTRDSIPFILSGEWNKNEKDIRNYSSDALNNSRLLNDLSSSNYQIGIYDNDFYWSSPKALTTKNLRQKQNDYFLVPFAKQEIKYTLFKHLPFALKRFSKIESLNFQQTRNTDQAPFDWSNLSFYNDTLKLKPAFTNEKIFKYIHIEGAHVPLDLDENLNHITPVNSDEHYKKKTVATAKIIKSYINYLKENDLYDNSAIVILADHGYSNSGTDKNTILLRANPILFIKGTNENHSKTRVNNKQISYDDLKDIYPALLSGKPSTSLFENIDEGVRSRPFIYYSYAHEDKMEQYNIEGNVWDIKSFKKTGEEFKR